MYLGHLDIYLKVLMKLTNYISGFAVLLLLGGCHSDDEISATKSRAWHEAALGRPSQPLLTKNIPLVEFSSIEINEGSTVTVDCAIRPMDRVSGYRSAVDRVLSAEEGAIRLDGDTSIRLTHAIVGWYTGPETKHLTVYKMPNWKPVPEQEWPNPVRKAFDRLKYSNQLVSHQRNLFLFLKQENEGESQLYASSIFCKNTDCFLGNSHEFTTLSDHYRMIGIPLKTWGKTNGVFRIKSLYNPSAPTFFPKEGKLETKIGPSKISVGLIGPHSWVWHRQRIRGGVRQIRGIADNPTMTSMFIKINPYTHEQRYRLQAIGSEDAVLGDPLLRPFGQFDPWMFPFLGCAFEVPYEEISKIKVSYFQSMDAIEFSLGEIPAPSGNNDKEDLLNVRIPYIETRHPHELIQLIEGATLYSSNASIIVPIIDRPFLKKEVTVREMLEEFQETMKVRLDHKNHRILPTEKQFLRKVNLQ